MAKAFPTIATGAPAPAAKTSVSSNQVVFAGETIAVTAAQLTLNALFGNVRVPKGAEILAVQLDSTDIDTNGSPAVVLTIGDVNDVDRLLTANTIGQTGAVTVGPTIAKTGFGYQYPDETLVQIQVAVIPGTAAAGTLKYGVWYVSQ